MGQLLAGPFCGQLLADFGAEVIKVEPPATGDPMRVWGRGKVEDGQGLWWPVVARNKKSVEVNLREAEGQQIIRDLVAKSDILIENFRAGTMEKWGLGYDELAAINPRLIMIRVSGYGQTGPYSHKAGYAAIGEAMGGLRYVVGDPSNPPSRTGISLGDTLAGTFGCIGGLMALHAREQTGRGQMVDSAIYEAVLAVMENLVTEYDQAGYIRERTGAILPNIAPSNVYPVKGGLFVLIAANQDTVFARLAAAMGRPELAHRSALCHACRARGTAGRTGRADRRMDRDDGPRGAGQAAGRSWRAARRHLSRAGDAGGRAFQGARRRSSRCRIRPSVRSRCRTSFPSFRTRPARSTGPGRSWASTIARYSRACWAIRDESIADLAARKIIGRHMMASGPPAIETRRRRPARRTAER